MSEAAGGSPLRVLHLDTHAGWGGGQRQALWLARGLRDRGHVQWLAVPRGAPLAERARAEGLDVLPAPRRAELDPRGAWRVVGLARGLDADVLHAHDAHALAHAAVAARLLRPRPVVVAHRRVAFPLAGGAAARWKWSRGPDRVIAVSEAGRRALAAARVPAERIAVVPDGVDLSAPPVPAGASLREAVGAPADAPVVLTIAALVGPKDHPTLVDAAARLLERRPDAWWVVLGEGPLLAEVRAEVERRGLARLRYPGFDPHARARLREADAFALASRSEGLGTSVLDAMAAGVPVAATAAGGVAEAFDDGESGLLVPVGDAAALAGAVERLLEDRDLARRLAGAARERVRAFDVRRMVAGTERVYREALAGIRAG